EAREKTQEQKTKAPCPSRLQAHRGQAWRKDRASSMAQARLYARKQKLALRESFWRVGGCAHVAENYQFFLSAKVSFSERGKLQPGFLEAGRALLSIASRVKGLTPLPALRALTSLRTSAPITGKRTRSPPAAHLAPSMKAFSTTALRSARLIRTDPERVA